MTDTDDLPTQNGVNRTTCAPAEPAPPYREVDALEAALNAVARYSSSVPATDWMALEIAVRDLRDEQELLIDLLASIKPWLVPASYYLGQFADHVTVASSAEEEAAVAARRQQVRHMVATFVEAYCEVAIHPRLALR